MRIKSARTFLLVTIFAISIISAIFYAPYGTIVHALDSDPWACPDCRYRVKLTFDNTGSSENLIDFPVLVVLDSSRIDYAKTSAADIRFFDGDTLLPKETELWNAAGNSYIWVKVPQIDNTNTDFIYAYYGCVGADNNDDAAAVWNGYAMVQHLEETSGPLTDSTANDNDGTTAGGLTQGATGKIASGVDFHPATSDYITVFDDPDGTLDFGTGSVSYMFWFRSRATTTQYVFSKQTGTLTSATPGYKTGISTETAIPKRFSANIGDGASPTAHTARVDSGAGGTYLWGTNVWGLLTVVIDRVAQTESIYLDGVFMSNAITGSPVSSVLNVDSPENLIIGKRVDGASNYFDGMMDEARIQNVAWSADWIEACYTSMNDNFITYGSEGTPNRLIESCDSAGDEKNAFGPTEAVRVFGSGYEASETYPIYVVVDDETKWEGGEALTRVSGTEETVSSDSSGNIEATIVWDPTLTLGKYDIVVDFNGNGYYDVGIDALDDNDVVTSAGFLVIPEYWLGALLGLVACFAAFGLFTRFKRIKTRNLGV